MPDMTIGEDEDEDEVFFDRAPLSQHEAAAWDALDTQRPAFRDFGGGVVGTEGGNLN